MEETSIQIDTAKLAKEKGFNYKPEYYYFPNDKRDGYNKIHKNHYFPNALKTLEQDYSTGIYNLTFPCPSQFLLQRWLREKHKIYIELIIDGWKDDNCVSDEFICYRAFIWQIGKPKPGPAEDLGASNYETILESALQSALELIK